ncbi:Histidine kinase 5 [Hordeum vulgare]|nr:Histidine kinase 5 [Hordeum vulgare]
MPEGELKEVNADKLGAQKRSAFGRRRPRVLPLQVQGPKSTGSSTSSSNLGDTRRRTPVVIWLDGRPGCSSELALFYENGPFHIAGNMSLLWNEFGWDQIDIYTQLCANQPIRVESNIIYVDQPTGTGFSYNFDSHDTRHNEAGVYQLHSSVTTVLTIENHGKDHEDALKDVEFREQPARVDLSRLAEIVDTEKAASQMQYFVKHWEYRRANNARLLNEELGRLSQQREEIEQKKQKIMEEDQQHDSTPYWKRRALQSEKAHGDVIGKIDHEILSGEGIDEMNKVKREVMAKGIPIKREFLFNTPLFGPKTFVVYIKPVLSKIGETIGVNYVALDITDQVKTREKMTDIRVREAVQKAKEIEHSRSPNITEDTPQAKQMLATMSHEIGSPLSEVLRIAELLATTKLDQEQHQLLELMLSSGNVVFQSIDGILGLSPKWNQVIGDALKIQEILTNLINFSNAVKFTQDGKVGINLNVVDKQQLECQIEHIRPHSASPIKTETEYYPASSKISDKDTLRCSNHEEAHQNGIPSNENSTGEAVWLCFDVYDTGIGIPVMPFLFKRYMHANEKHTTKYGGTGLGLAVCKQLVDLMGGTLTVLSKENEGSTFTVMFPCIIPARQAQ